MTDDAGQAAPASMNCQWCGAIAAPGATHCGACGAALPLDAPLGGMVIPGVTDVDPELAVYRTKNLRIPKGSPSQLVAGHAIGAASADPTGLIGFGALAAMAASEYLGASHGRPGQQIDPEKVGLPSEPVLEMARRLQQEQAEKAAQAPTEPSAEEETPKP